MARTKTNIHVTETTGAEVGQDSFNPILEFAYQVNIAREMCKPVLTDKKKYNQSLQIKSNSVDAAVVLSLSSQT